MKLITRDTDYALRALCFLAKKQKKIISVAELVKALKIPRPFLRKILQTLNKNGILRSYKGKGGGFMLARLPDKIFLLDLTAIFQGALKINECLFKKGPCPGISSCKLKKKMDKIQQYIVAELNNISLAYLLKGK